MSSEELAPWASSYADSTVMWQNGSANNRISASATVLAASADVTREVKTWY
jgi:hypothetical protein